MSGATLVHPSLRRRLFGLGSVFGKAALDSRRGAIVVTFWIVLLLLISGAFVSSSWGTEQTRQESVRLAVDLPEIITGLYGGSGPNVDTLGGFTSWRYGILFFLLPGIWSLLALSNTLVAEGRRGSMDFIAACPIKSPPDRAAEAGRPRSGHDARHAGGGAGGVVGGVCVRHAAG